MERKTGLCHGGTIQLGEVASLVGDNWCDTLVERAQPAAPGWKVGEKGGGDGADWHGAATVAYASS
jgi:hypothetical protein